MSRTETRPFAVACPGCRATIGVERTLVGAPARCPLCGDGFQVPDPGPVASARTGSRRAVETAPAPSPAAAAAPQAGAAEGAARSPRSVERPAAARDGTSERTRLLAQERARRRARRSIVILLGGISILVVLTLALARGRRR